MEERNTDERSPYSKPGFVVSAVLLGFLLLAALFVVIGAAMRHHTARHAATTARTLKPTKQTSEAGVTTTAAKSPAQSSCSLPAGSQAVPTVPPVMRWVTVGQMAAPQAPARFGPQREHDGIGVCFAHNPTGALVAAVNFFAEATVANPVTMIRTLAANTAGRATALLQAQDGGDQLLQNSDGDPGSVQVMGYEIVDYTPAQENVNVALEGPGGEMASVECQLDWQDNDWKFVIPTGGQLNGSAITSMDGFVSWTNTGGGEL